MFTQKMKTILGLQKLNPIIWLATSPPFQTVDQKIRVCSKEQKVIMCPIRINTLHLNLNTLSPTGLEPNCANHISVIKQRCPLIQIIQKNG